MFIINLWIVLSNMVTRWEVVENGCLTPQNACTNLVIVKFHAISSMWVHFVAIRVHKRVQKCLNWSSGAKTVIFASDNHGWFTQDGVFWTFNPSKWVFSPSWVTFWCLFIDQTQIFCDFWRYWVLAGQFSGQIRLFSICRISLGKMVSFGHLIPQNGCTHWPETSSAEKSSIWGKIFLSF